MKILQTGGQIQRLEISAAQNAEIAADKVASSQDHVGRPLGIPATWIGEDSGEKVSFSGGQLAGGLLVEMFSGSLGAIDARSELDDIEIDLKDAPFIPNGLNEKCEISLETFSKIGTGGIEENILGRLLRNSGSPDFIFAVLIGLDGLTNGLQIKTKVVKELWVFGGNDGLLEVGGKSLLGEPTLSEWERFYLEWSTHGPEGRSEGCSRPEATSTSAPVRY